MISSRHRLIRGLGVLWAIGLLLLPLLLSQHGHDATASRSDTCALCVATHCSPATTAPPIPQPAPLLRAIAHAARDLAPLASRSAPRPSGRAPPSVRFVGTV
jgi:hypothetical protein